MSYYYQKIISNEVIHEIEKMLYEGKTYKQIQEVLNVSNGTISRVKKGSITSDRIIKDSIDLVPISEVSKIKRQLDEARKKVLEQNQEIYNLKNEIEELKDKINSMQVTKNTNNDMKNIELDFFGYVN